MSCQNGRWQQKKDLMSLLNASSAFRNSSYELIRHLNDVNRKYNKVLAEQNVNDGTNTVYTYGNERIRRKIFRQSRRTSYCLCDSGGRWFRQNAKLLLTGRYSCLCRKGLHKPSKIIKL